jgi:hypothetical protein
MRRKDRRSPERSRGNRGVAELRAEALGTGPMGRDIQDLGYELPRMPIPRTRVNRGKGKGRGCNYSLSPAFTYR